MTQRPGGLQRLVRALRGEAVLRGLGDGARDGDTAAGGTVAATAGTTGDGIPKRRSTELTTPQTLRLPAVHPARERRQRLVAGRPHPVHRLQLPHSARTPRRTRNRPPPMLTRNRWNRQARPRNRHVQGRGQPLRIQREIRLHHVQRRQRDQGTALPQRPVPEVDGQRVTASDLTENQPLPLSRPADPLHAIMEFRFHYTEERIIYRVPFRNSGGRFGRARKVSRIFKARPRVHARTAVECATKINKARRTAVGWWCSAASAGSWTRRARPARRGSVHRPGAAH